MSASRRTRRSRFLLRTSLFTGLLLVLTGCSTEKIPNHAMPDPITNHGHEIISLWKGSWVAAWAVGILVWGLILWCIVRYRKRGDELPPQVHYNIPVEILYTIVPFVIIAVLFWFTAYHEEEIDELSANPDMTVNVVGYQWAWQFNYLDGPARGLQVHGRPGQFPELVLPVGQTIRFKLTSPDVIHAFWVPDFLFKRDVVPGRVNEFELVVEKEGTFRGYCTELCGVDHDRMLFTMRSVPQSEFATFARTALTEARAGETNKFTYNATADPGAVDAGTGNEPTQGQEPGED